MKTNKKLFRKLSPYFCTYDKPDVCVYIFSQCTVWYGTNGQPFSNKKEKMMICVGIAKDRNVVPEKGKGKRPF